MYSLRRHQVFIRVMMYIYNQIHVKKYVSFLKERIAEIKYYNRLKFKFSVIIHEGGATLQAEPFFTVHMLCTQKDKRKEKAKRDKRLCSQGEGAQNPGAKLSKSLSSLQVISCSPKKCSEELVHSKSFIKYLLTFLVLA